MTQPTQPAIASGGERTFPGARTALIVLTLINLLNYFDRFIVSSLVESLKASELSITDAQAGLLMTSFIVVYTLVSPIFGGVGDGTKRLRWLAFGVAVWSLATSLSGLVRNYVQLLVARGLVGIGEAAYGTIAPALLSDYYPEARRGRVFAVFFMAIPVGAALGYAIGGLLDEAYGWRMAFMIAGLPGLLLAGALLRLKDPACDPSYQANRPERVGGLREDLKIMRGIWVKNRPYRLAALGYAAYTFAIGGLAFWIPAFLVRMRGFTQTEATVQFGLIVIGTGFLGTFVGGRLNDWWMTRHRGGHMMVCALSAFLATPFVFAALVVEDRVWLTLLLVLAELFAFLAMAPINAAIVGVVAAHHRATAMALSIFVMHVFGDVPSPWLIGWVSDRSDLATGILIVPAGFAVAAWVWWLGAQACQRIPKDS